MGSIIEEKKAYQSLEGHVREIASGISRAHERGKYDALHEVVRELQKGLMGRRGGPINPALAFRIMQECKESWEHSQRTNEAQIPIYRAMIEDFGEEEAFPQIADDFRMQEEESYGKTPPDSAHFDSEADWGDNSRSWDYIFPREIQTCDELIAWSRVYWVEGVATLNALTGEL